MSQSSSSSTVLPSPPPSRQPESEISSDVNHDVPVSISAFSRNVKWCKGLLGPALAADLALEIGQVVLLPKNENRTWSSFEKMAYQQEKIANYAGLATVVSDRLSQSPALTSVQVTLLLLYAVTLAKPVSRPRDTGEPMRNLPLHRSLCITAFLLTICLLILHAAPHIAFTALTYLPSPDFYPVLVPAAPEISISRVRNILLVVTLLVAGCMRRGPKMKYTPMRLGTGFGVSLERDDAKALDTKVSLTNMEDVELLGKKWEEVGEHSNVLDYSNSAMLDFITLSYVSKVRKRPTPWLAHHMRPSY